MIVKVEKRDNMVCLCIPKEELKHRIKPIRRRFIKHPKLKRHLRKRFLKQRIPRFRWW